MSSPSYFSGLNLSGYDLENKGSLKNEIATLNTAFMVLVVLVTVLRMSVRFRIHAAGFDDFLMVFATVITVLLSSFSIVRANKGLGTHVWNLSSSQPVFLHMTMRITQSLYGCYLAYATAITLVKCSIIFSYLRVFPNPKLRKLALGTGGLVVAMWLCSLLAIIFACIPVQSAWNWTLRRDRCIDIVSFFYFSSSMNLATDVLLWAVPLPLFWKMNLRLRERILICVLFGFSAFACRASMLRLAQLHGLRSADITYTIYFLPVAITRLLTSDPSDTSVPSLNWSVAEVSTAIVCACIPSMRPLAAFFLPVLLGRSSSKTVPSSTSPRREVFDLDESHTKKLSRSGNNEGNNQDVEWQLSKSMARSTDEQVT